MGMNNAASLSNATNVAATARTILRYTPESVSDIATYGYKGALPPGLNADGEFELRNAIQDEAKRLDAASISRSAFVAYYRESVRRWKERVNAADAADDDSRWAAAMSGLNRAETELRAAAMAAETQRVERFRANEAKRREFVRRESCRGMNPAKQHLT